MIRFIVSVSGNISGGAQQSPENTHSSHSLLNDLHKTLTTQHVRAYTGQTPIKQLPNNLKQNNCTSQFKLLKTHIFCLHPLIYLSR